ncbi:chaplin family protein [Actinomadura sp. NPDC000600]|uniref:chaplin family protein n=1 Tax=Actinomadura sp. NPDC000600 TaxID=3154262 RepID=UPI00339A7EC1
MRRTSRAMLTAGFVALGVSAVPANAFADVTNGDGGVLSGNQVKAPISAPVNVSGNAVAVLGIAQATSKGGAKVVQNGGGAAQQTTSGTGGVGSGNQVDAPISVPVNACGNGVAVLGIAQAGCTGGAKVKNTGGQDTGTGGQVTDGKAGVLSGNQVKAPISAPVDVCGNAVAVIGQAVAGCEGGAKVTDGGTTGSTGSRQETSGKGGVLSGNQADVPISVPVNVCGNAIGNAVAACEGGATVKQNGGTGGAQQTTSGAGGVLSGNQANVPISIPVNVCGNAAAVIGEAGAACEGGATVKQNGTGGAQQTTSGEGSVLGGNQVLAPISIPVNVCGNAVAVVGQATGACTGKAAVKGSSGSGGTTSGTGGVGSGNQADVPVEAPVDVCGNGAAVIGLASPAPQCDDPGDNGGYEPSPSRMAGTAPRPGSSIDVPLVGGLAGGLVGGLGAPSLPVAAPNQRTAAPSLGGDGAPAPLSPVLNAVSQTGATALLPKTGAAQRVRQDGGTPVTLPVPVKPVVPAGVHGVPAPKAADVPGEIGPARHVAATETITPESRTGAALLTAVSGLLAAAAGITVLARRIRVGRR